MQGTWVGSTLHTLYTQEKNELILQAETPLGEVLYMKVLFSPAFCCLSFPPTHHRARKNSMNLFKSIEDCTIGKIHMFENERAFSFLLDNGQLLVFKVFGNRSNLILFEDNKIIEVFRSELKNDYSITPNLDRPIDQSRSAFDKSGGDYRSLYPTFGKHVHAYLQSKGYDQISSDERWILLKETVAVLEDPEYRVIEDNEILLTLLPDKEGKEFNHPVQALNYFYQQYFMKGLLFREKKPIIKSLEKEVSKSEKYIRRLYQKLDALAHGSSYRHQADLIMANLQNIPKGAKKVSLTDFYDPKKNIEVTLNPKLSAQDNAGHLYHKAKNQHRETDELEKNIQHRERQLDLVRKQLAELTKIQEIQALRTFIKTNELGNDTIKKEAITLPYREYLIDGFVVRVGKNARSNDQMIQKYSYKDDLWLHAKDVPGSHVLIKFQAGKPFPSPVIEKAASLAAFYSKRKNDSLCPVIVTPRKFVRKRKGDPPGAVVVDRENEVLLVPPEDVN